MNRLLALGLTLGGLAFQNVIPSYAYAEDYLSQYTSHGEMLRQLKKLKVKTQKIGESHSGKSILAVRFGDEDAPAILVAGNVDGDYLVGTELALRLVKDLKNGSVERHGKTVFIVPMPNPDATDFMLSKKGYSTTFNTAKTDDDHDLKTNEDPPNDLNKDGFISQLRISDKTGLFKPAENNPELLVKVDPAKNESGQYRLISEGLDDDGDGLFDEDGFGGVALNKNFTYNYDYFGIGSGINQASESETRALIDFVLDHKNILMTVNFSKYDNLHKNWDSKEVAVEDYPRRLKAFRKMPKEDSNSYKLFSELWKKDHKNWKVKAENRGQGAFHDWAYFHGGRWSIATNGWNYQQIKLEKSEGESSDGDNTVEDKKNNTKKHDTKEARLLHDATAKQLTGAVIPWKTVKHPDFKNEKVEVGGFNTSYLNNPDYQVFSETKSSEFVASLTQLFPSLEVTQTVDKVANDLYRVTLKIKNLGKLPTQSAMGKLSRWMNPVRVQWNLPKERFMAGTKRTLLEPIGGLGGTQELKWLINTKGHNKAKFEITSPVIPSVKQTVNFGA